MQNHILTTFLFFCFHYSLRTYISIHYFPKMLFLYFLLLHMYTFCCPFGFTYAAFSTLVLFELHLMLYFLNAFEIPAYAAGHISAIRPRYFYTASAAVASTTVTTAAAAGAAQLSPLHPPPAPVPVPVSISLPALSPPLACALSATATATASCWNSASSRQFGHPSSSSSKF